VASYTYPIATGSVPTDFDKEPKMIFGVQVSGVEDV
jgi:hypothetical protein